MNANDLTFGVEFETTMPAGSVSVGGYHNGLQVEWLPNGWTAQRDGSIVATPGRIGVEFVSPVLRGAEGLKQVLEVLEALNARGARVNASCGFHVHVGSFGAENAKVMERLTTLVANFEKAIYASTGTKRREQSRWCGSIQRYGNAANAQQIARGMRYHVLNLTNTPRIGTVEFRAFAGTLNKVKVVGYIRMCLGLVERAVKAQRVTNFVAPAVSPTSPIARKGDGQTALTRLFYQLGWTKGRTKETFGNVDCDHAPEMDMVKRELMRMAKKYDT